MTGVTCQIAASASLVIHRAGAVKPSHVLHKFFEIASHAGDMIVIVRQNQHITGEKHELEIN
jgi:hypothetical protein